MDLHLLATWIIAGSMVLLIVAKISLFVLARSTHCLIRAAVAQSKANYATLETNAAALWRLEQLLTKRRVRR